MEVALNEGSVGELSTGGVVNSRRKPVNVVYMDRFLELLIEFVNCLIFLWKPLICDEVELVERNLVVLQLG